MTIQEFWETDELIAIHCDTMQKAKKLLKVFTRMGKTWSSGLSYTKSFWSDHKENTCYDNTHKCSHLPMYKIAKAKIVEFDDLDDFKVIEDYKGEKPYSLSSRAWKTYNLIKNNTKEGKWTSKKEIIENNPFNPQSNIDGYIKNDRKHDLCAGIWEDIETINMSPSLEKIIISNGKNEFKLAENLQEGLEYIEIYKNKLVKAAIRYYTLRSKMIKDGQGKLLTNNNEPIDIEGKAREFVEAFMKEGE